MAYSYESTPGDQERDFMWAMRSYLKLWNMFGQYFKTKTKLTYSKDPAEPPGTTQVLHSINASGFVIKHTLFYSTSSEWYQEVLQVSTQ